MAILFITEKLPLALTSMSGAAVLVLAGVIEIPDLFSAFSSSTVVLLVSMMIIGASLFHTGIASIMSDKIIQFTGTTEKGIMIGTLISTALLSSICSGVAVVAMMLPIVIGISTRAKVSVSRQLIPLCFAASFAGNLTLVGAASNVIVSGQMKILGVRPLSFLELGKVGLPITILGILYFLIAGKAFLTPGDSSDKEYLYAFMGKTSIQSQSISIKGILNIVILFAVLAAMALDNDALPMHLVAALGAMVMVLTGCIKENDAYKAVDWSTIFIVAGMSAVSKAMDASGAAQLLSTSVASMIGTESSKLLVLFVIVGFTMLLTNFMMNTTTAVLLTPLFIPLAIALEINPVAVGVGICVAASSPFLTPVGSGTNTLIVKPGNLKFMDFFRPGLGVSILIMACSIVFIPLFWPL
ncbi:SLC13 family permease [Youngiibacter multivorans]|uniref:Anion transporter n=1 Tax=Youngiibacter multivorans TaxID=937251 RepID=A0ABS4G8M6_9CLOT|nr:SLC13 family permease [Youngiibacter multivorans]MBP1920874.1 anion transporter [Youngiibacter multivorans]